MTDATEGEKDNVWDRLRRRKVVQWGIVYAAGAWGFLRGLEYVVESFNWPQQYRQVALLGLLIGLPVVLVLAWYHGDRGQQRVSRAELAIITLLFLVGGGIFWRYDRASEEVQATRTPVAAPTSQVTTVDAGPSIAVLPFDNRSAKADDAGPMADRFTRWPQVYTRSPATGGRPSSRGRRRLPSTREIK